MTSVNRCNAIPTKLQYEALLVEGQEQVQFIPVTQYEESEMMYDINHMYVCTVHNMYIYELQIKNTSESDPHS